MAHGPPAWWLSCDHLRVPRMWGEEHSADQPVTGLPAIVHAQGEGSSTQADEHGATEMTTILVTRTGEL